VCNCANRINASFTDTLKFAFAAQQRFFDVGGTPVRLTRKCGADVAFGASQQDAESITTFANADSGNAAY
jgi:hypothetical protein